MKQTIFIFILLIALLSGCLRKEQYPDEPRIAFDRFTVEQDSATLVFTFTDGDGNFGLTDTDFTDPTDCPKNYNLFCEYFEKINGEWVWIELNPCVNPNVQPFYSRVPFAEPSGQFKAQKGEVKIVMDDYYLDSEYDTCKFDIYVVDLTQNKSNVISTQEFVKPE